MSLTLYRKYRPKNFSEIIGQKHIVETLSNAIRNNRVGQAYLFTGPRGTGKTSIARILAKTVNCENLDGAKTCEKCAACRTIGEGRSLDIIEIDAASYTGVDNIRELRETVNLPPTSLRYKVYIIDEVHMLSTGAFNALLKTLEEPPAHVIFILATTEIHKVPETIISRCQRFDFARLPIQNIIEKLSFIAESENIKIDDESLEMIAIAAEGGMRDAESLLSQIIALEDKNITRKEVEEILGTTDRKFAYEMSELIITGETDKAIAKINALLTEGYDLAVFNKSLINYLRQLMLLKISPSLKSYFTYELTGEQLEKMATQAQRAEMGKILSAIDLFLDAQGKISSFLLPQLPLEIAIIKATGTFPAEPEMNSKLKVQSEKLQSKTQSQDKQKLNSKSSAQKYEVNTGSVPKSSTEEQFNNLTIEEVKDKWSQFLEAIKPHNHSLKALLSNCRVSGVKGQGILLRTSYDFYKERLNEPRNKAAMEEVLGNILGQKVILKTVTNKEASVANQQSATDNEQQRNPLLQSALEILGGKVVEE
jgi:DNA polymerase-3 subunit gamma/tau